MKTILMAALGGFAVLSFAAPAEAQVDRRQWTQQDRIWHGYRSGALTGREAWRLERQQSRIARYEARSRWDGGGLSYAERARLSRMQNRASRSIYRQKHDRQGRPSIWW